MNHAIFLHPTTKNDLRKVYQDAFKSALELYVVSAYLTDWDDSLELNPTCRHFRLIVGRDFGITRKAACVKALGWLNPTRKAQFLVADNISGFHPKALLWKDKTGRCQALIGSSNLTRAAFYSNFEANIVAEISVESFDLAKSWIKDIESKSVGMSEDWLASYVEATQSKPVIRRPKAPQSSEAVVPWILPDVKHAAQLIRSRRKQMKGLPQARVNLKQLFENCAAKKISSAQFYDSLNDAMGDIGFQSGIWKISGKNSDFAKLSRSALMIIDADPRDRDDIVVEQIDRLKQEKVATRGAFLSEILCHFFPNEYPLKNDPIERFLVDADFRPPRGSSEGVKYVDLSKKLRCALIANPSYPAKNLAELDVLIQDKYRGEG